MAAILDLPNESFHITLVNLYFRFINTMSSSSVGKCLLCFITILVKNFKRHCDARHNSVDIKEKYEKLLKKFKQIINNLLCFF